MTPEEKTRQGIDRQLELCGWLAQDADEMKAEWDRESPSKTVPPMPGGQEPSETLKTRLATIAGEIWGMRGDRRIS